MQPYCPEGIYATPPSPEALRRGVHTGEVFQAMCTKCDEHHDLHVDLGPIHGIIPRSEATLLPSGEYAILSRVGKSVSFQVLSFDGDTAILSRREAQKDARNYFLSALLPGDVIPAVVQNATPLGLFCDIGCGFTARMRIDRCCISRLGNAADRFYAGQNIFCAVLRIDDANNRLELTGKELLGTWAENAAKFRDGQTVTGTVRSIMPYGVFIELLPNLSGLAETQMHLQPGDHVSVFIRSIQPSRHKIKLNVLEVLQKPVRMETEFFIRSGHICRWEYYPGGSFTNF